MVHIIQTISDNYIIEDDYARCISRDNILILKTVYNKLKILNSKDIVSSIKDLSNLVYNTNIPDISSIFNRIHLTKREHINNNSIINNSLVPFNMRYNGSDTVKYMLNITSSDINNILKDLNSTIINSGKDLTVSIISGGHCYENFIMNKELLINVKSLDSLGIATQEELLSLKLYTNKNIIFAQPGCYNWNSALYLANNFGVFIPGGSCYSVCLGGHICGGGYGIDSKKYGLTVDNIKGVELIVFKNNKYKPIYGTATAFNNWYNHIYLKYPLFRSLSEQVFTPEAAAWFACTGGGGGNYGLITKYYFDITELPTIPTKTYYTTINIPYYKDNKIMTQQAFSRIIKNYMNYNIQSQDDNKEDNIFAFMFIYYRSSNNLGIKFVVWGNDNSLSPQDTSFFKSIFGDLSNINIYSDIDTINTDNDIYLSNWSDVYNNLDSGIHVNSYSYSSLDVSINYSVNSMPYLLNKQNSNGSGPNRKFKNQCIYLSKDNYLGQTSDDIRITNLYNYFVFKWKVPFWSNSDISISAPENITAYWQLDTYGGKINRNPPKNATFNRRNLICKIQSQCYWDDTLNSSPDISYINYWNSVYFSIADQSINGQKLIDNGVYINYPHVEIKTKYPKKWEEYYYGNMAPHIYTTPSANTLYTGTILKQCKKILDPSNIFNNKLTISTLKY